MATEQHYDAIIIGSGQGGFPLAMQLAGKGLEAAIVESREVGGTCVNWGCTPTKTMVASARAAYVAREAGRYGVRSDVSGIDMVKVRQRKRDIVSDFSGGSERYIEETDGVTLIRGEARFERPGVLRVAGSGGSDTRLTADRTFINTGTRPSVPPIPGLSDVRYLTNETIMELDEVPMHLIVIGGGYIGCEFGQMFRRFGAEVTILQRSDQLLPREDADIAGSVTESLKAEGVRVLTGADTETVRESASGIEADVTHAKGTETLRGSHILVATGRAPNTDMLNLEAAGIATDRGGYITANDRLETAAADTWVIGDVKGGPAFTHISYDDSRIIMRNLFGDGAGSIAGRLVPYTVFIDPQLGRVGISERDAAAAGIEYRVAKLPMTSVARALETDETTGFMKALVGKNDDTILGFAMHGMQAGEIAGATQIAMMGQLPFTVIRDGVFSHPTLVESLNNLFATVK